MFLFFLLQYYEDHREKLEATVRGLRGHIKVLLYIYGQNQGGVMTTWRPL